MMEPKVTVPAVSFSAPYLLGPLPANALNGEQLILRHIFRIIPGHSTDREGRDRLDLCQVDRADEDGRSLDMYFLVFYTEYYNPRLILPSYLRPIYKLLVDVGQHHLLDLVPVALDLCPGGPVVVL